MSTGVKSTDRIMSIDALRGFDMLCIILLDHFFRNLHRGLDTPVTGFLANQFTHPEWYGFHFYDINFSLEVARKWKVVVTNRIDMIHLTVGGDFGNAWVDAALVFHHAKGQHLPLATNGVNAGDADRAVAKYWLDWLKNFKISFSKRVRWVVDQNFLFKPFLWYSIAKFFLYRPLGLKYIHRMFKRKGD